ncbi:hypothetical protein D9613_004291 [Agrocybe pediades]|uniref:Thioesterase domain-containing protein n=1 Tax=Agrocybe pediades TaxID=84607 RepID=A0A8H4VJS0_9AGAR|nr:hypothetical protein D9613_004291 [Agrocybe pediades]
MGEQNLKARRRGDYVFFLEYRTRWSDNDQYSHINNAVYYHFFDSIINTYLIEKCGLDPKSSPLIGLVVSSYCQFFFPLSFPQVLELGLRVNNLGNSSVSYEKNNSFIVNRVPEGPVFSKEPGNLRNLNSFKYSGLANSKTIDVQEKAGSIKIVTRKVKASPHAVASAYATTSVRPRSGGRRALGIAAATAKRSYRPDLRTRSTAAALARVSALIAAQQEKKAAPAKKVRGKKAVAASA